MVIQKASSSTYCATARARWRESEFPTPTASPPLSFIVLSAAVWLSNFFFPLTFTFDSVGTNFQKFVAYSRKSRRDLAADCGITGFVPWHDAYRCTDGAPRRSPPQSVAVACAPAALVCLPSMNPGHPAGTTTVFQKEADDDQRVTKCC